MIVTWLSLDSDDNEVNRFWTYAIAALQTARADLGQATLRQLRLLAASPISAFLTPVLNDLAACAQQIVLVLDDYHLISLPAIHTGTEYLLDHQPALISLVAVGLYWNGLILLFPHNIGAIGVDITLLVCLIALNWLAEADIGFWQTWR